MSESIPCTICANITGNRSFTAQERMFGGGESFTYMECAGCGCLNLLDPPIDLGRYYPADYYSYRAGPLPRPTMKPRAIHWALHHLAAKRMGAFDLIGRAGTATGKLAWVPRMEQGFRSRVLDVGCGSGALLLLLRNIGFTSLTGADPFIAEDIHYPNGVRILKQELSEVMGTFDLIHLGHAFEHMAGPLMVLKHLHGLLAPGGVAVVRIPVADSFAWRHYGVHWVQLDAPRHFFLHTAKSMRILADGAGLLLEKELRDSTAFQFMGSEKYLLGLPLGAAGPFTVQQRKTFAKRARELNAKGEGDTVTFHLRKA